MSRRCSALLTGTLVLLASLATVPAAHSGVAADEEAWTEFTAYPVVSFTPDTNTRVYQAVYAASPAHETVIRGRVPAARFWSFAILDPARREIANVSDEDVNVDGEGHFEITVSFGCGDRANCLDASNSVAPGVPDRILYRIYVPEHDAFGGVPLPEVEYRTAEDASTIAPPFPPGTAQQILAATTDPLRPGGFLHDTTAQPSPFVRPVTEPGPDPEVERFRGLGAAQEQQLRDANAPDPVVQAVHDVRGQGGFGATADNAYVTVAYASRFGDLMLTGKAPTYTQQSESPANTLGRPQPASQTRYWSLCTVQGSRPVDCVRDERVPVDSHGHFTILVAADCTRENVADEMLCLRMGGAGGVANGSVIYRNLLARRNFSNTDGPRECPQRPSQFCGDYALTARYVPRP